MKQETVEKIGSGVGTFLRCVVDTTKKVATVTKEAAIEGKDNFSVAYDAAKTSYQVKTLDKKMFTPKNWVSYLAYTFKGKFNGMLTTMAAQTEKMPAEKMTLNCFFTEITKHLTDDEKNNIEVMMNSL